MKLIKSLFAVLVTLLSFVVGILLVAGNKQQVVLDLQFVQLPALGLSLWLLLAIGIGFVLGLLANLGGVLLLKNTHRRTKKALKVAEHKLSKLQGIQ